MKIVIPDLHFTEKRVKAIKTGVDSVLNSMPEHCKEVILLGDIYNKYPTMKERVMFAEFLQMLKKRTDTIILIKGTHGHDYSKSIYNLEDIAMLMGLKACELYDSGEYIYGHFEVKGAKYSNGFISQSTRTVSAKRNYILGHIHLPSKVKNVIYCGSLYKTSFSERDENKRFLSIFKGQLQSLAIETRPMYQIELIGKEGKVKCKQAKLIKELEPKSEIDLKIVVNTDNQSIGVIHRNIAKIRAKFNIEYYKEDINTTEIKIDLPKDLDQSELLKEYCKSKKVKYLLIEKEL